MTSAADEIAAAVRLLPMLADAAGAIIRRHFRTCVEVLDKSDASPVTIADRDAEASLRALIEQHFPHHGIVGEEHGSAQVDAEFVWTIDPIDGTGQFISGLPLFGTLVALLHDGVPVVGLLDQPILRERWIGVAGEKTTMNGVAVQTRRCAEASAATLFATTPEMFRDGDQDRFDALRPIVKRVRYGADCYAYGMVASGFVDIVVEARTKPWDYCAHVPIIEGAGGVITDWQGAALGLRSDGRVLASGDPGLHEKFVASLR